MTYQLWDSISSTLLAQTSDSREIAAVVQSYVNDVGRDVLDDLSLSIDEGEASTSYSGEDVIWAIQARIAQDWVNDHGIVDPVHR